MYDVGKSNCSTSRGGPCPTHFPKFSNPRTDPQGRTPHDTSEGRKDGQYDPRLSWPRTAPLNGTRYCTPERDTGRGAKDDQDTEDLSKGKVPGVGEGCVSDKTDAGAEVSEVDARKESRLSCPFDPPQADLPIPAIKTVVKAPGRGLVGREGGTQLPS